jgi:hypothetical protein
MSKSPLRIWQDILTTLATCKNLAKAAGPQLTGHHAHAEGMHTLLEGVHMYCEELEVTMQQMPKPVWQTLVYTFKVGLWRWCFGTAQLQPVAAATGPCRL